MHTSINLDENFFGAHFDSGDCSSRRNQMLDISGYILATSDCANSSVVFISFWDHLTVNHSWLDKGALTWLWNSYLIKWCWIFVTIFFITFILKYFFDTYRLKCFHFSQIILPICAWFKSRMAQPDHCHLPSRTLSINNRLLFVMYRVYRVYR